MKVQDAIESRCSIRKFSNKKVNWDKVLEAIDAANQAPFAGNINNLKFIIIENPKTIQKLTECCQQDWINDSSYVVVVCADTKKLIDLYDNLGKTYSKHQVGAAIQNFLLRITELGLASCWVGSFVDNQIKRELKIPENYDVEAILPIGYSSKKTKKPKKERLEKTIFWEKWNQSYRPTSFHDPSS
jgi:nitroreductase